MHQRVIVIYIILNFVKFLPLVTFVWLRTDGQKDEKDIRTKGQSDIDKTIHLRVRRGIKKGNRKLSPKHTQGNNEISLYSPKTANILILNKLIIF